MKRKDFQDLELPSYYKKRKDAIHSKELIDSTKAVSDLVHVDSAASFPPFSRGIYPMMYLTTTWKSKNAYIISEKSFQNLQEARERLAEKPLDKIEVLFPSGKSCFPLIAAYITIAEEQQVPNGELTFFLEDRLDKYSSGKETALIRQKLLPDLLSFVKSERLYSFKGIRISESNLQKEGLPLEEKLAQSLLQGWRYLALFTQLGLPADKAAGYISFSWEISADFFSEIARIRAGRILWAKIVHTYNPSDSQAMALRLHTMGATASEQNSSGRAIEEQLAAMTGIFAGTQQLKINSDSKEIDRKLKRFLKHEAPINHPIDPWAGSHEMEKMTDQIARRSWKLILAEKPLPKPEENKAFSSNRKASNGIAKYEKNRLTVIMDSVQSNKSFKSIEKELFG